MRSTLPKHLRKAIKGINGDYCASSNLATPTKKGLIRDSKATFFPENASVADNSGNKDSRTPLINQSGYPYHPAKLKPVDHDMTKPWYIIFYIWDVGSEKLVRRRVLKRELAMRRDKNDRLQYAKQCIKEINHDLKHGGYQESEEKIINEVSLYNFSKHTLLNALDFIIKHKRDFEKVERSTVKEYNATKTTVIDFLKSANIPNTIKLRSVNKNFVDRYLNYLNTERKLGAKTYNCRAGNMRAAINKLLKLDHNLKIKNHFDGVEFLKTTTHKHAAYTDAQMIELRDSLIANNEQFVLLFIQFIYFTLARPRKEVRLIKVGHIDLAYNRILITGENAKSDVEDYVGISSAFKKIIEASGIMKYPKNYYVFSYSFKHGFNPGVTPVGENVYYKRFVNHLDKLGYRELNPNYDMYSFKHSGTIGLYMATKDVYVVMKQLRHTSLEQVMKYLRELGLFLNAHELNKWENPFE